jgi:putative hydrolases of HD superfamily
LYLVVPSFPLAVLSITSISFKTYNMNAESKSGTPRSAPGSDNGILKPSLVINEMKAVPHSSALPKPEPWSVRAVLSQLPNPPQEGSTSPIPFFHYLERLKVEKREGWRRFGILRGESIADHMYRMSLITMLAPPSLSSKLDIPRCTKMALVHDMAEGLVGDLTPVDGVPKVEKNRREAETVDWIAQSLLGKVQGGIAGHDLKAAWQEYEDSETMESLFVHDVDKIELILQMVEYERAYNCTLDLSEFSWVAKKLCLPEMKAWAHEILDERQRLWADQDKQPRDPVTASTIKEQQDEYYGGTNGYANGSAK